MPIAESRTYYIQPQCGEETGLVLGAGNSEMHQAPPVLVPISSDFAVWRLTRVEDRNEFIISPHRLHFLSRLRPWDQQPMIGYLQPHGGDKPALIMGAPEGGFSYTIHTWRLEPSGPPPWVAIQVAQDIRQNLNVAGNGPYPAGTPIYTYHWSDGQTNERWHVIPQIWTDGVISSVDSSRFVIDDVEIYTNAFTGGVTPAVGDNVIVEGIRTSDHILTAVQIRHGGRRPDEG